jgi:hypothetical protein
MLINRESCTRSAFIVMNTIHDDKAIVGLSHGTRGLEGSPPVPFGAPSEASDPDFTTDFASHMTARALPGRLRSGP